MEDVVEAEMARAAAPTNANTVGKEVQHQHLDVSSAAGKNVDVSFDSSVSGTEVSSKARDTEGASSSQPPGADTGRSAAALAGCAHERLGNAVADSGGLDVGIDGAAPPSQSQSGSDSRSDVASKHSPAWEERHRVIQELIYGAKEVNYFSVNMGTGMSRAKYSLPNPYHVQNLLRSMSERLPKYQYQLVPANADVDGIERMDGDGVGMGLLGMGLGLGLVQDGTAVE